MKSYYRKNSGFEAIDVILSWRMTFPTGNAIKYLCRSGLKHEETKQQDLQKALDYLIYERDDLKRLSSDNQEEDIRPEEVSIAWDCEKERERLFVSLKEASDLRLRGDYLSAQEKIEEAISSLQRILDP